MVDDEMPGNPAMTESTESTDESTRSGVADAPRRRSTDAAPKSAATHVSVGSETGIDPADAASGSSSQRRRSDTATAGKPKSDTATAEKAKSAKDTAEKPKSASAEKSKSAKATAEKSKPAKSTAKAAKPEGEPADADAPSGEPAAKSRSKKNTAKSAPAVAPTTALLFQAPDLPTPDIRDIADDEAAGTESAGTESTTSRRRNRRRGGGDGQSGDQNAGGRSPDRQNAGGNSGDQGSGGGRGSGRTRQRAVAEPITEPQKVKGSTRLEAKKQRRRDGRDAGRRRPVVTEAEFLARRESVDRVMIVRSKDGRIQIAVLEDGVLVEHYVARSQDASLIGNVYLGRVQNVLPSMEAAFVDIGRGRNAVLYSGEVDWDAAAANAEAEGKAVKNQPRRIELALKSGDKVLVQVTKDPVGHKGARLTSQISLPGRFLVYVPNGSMNGISRKLPDTERARLKRILKEVLPDDAGVIVRTAAEGATQEQLTLDVTRLTAQWADIERAVETQQAPYLLHSEPDLLVKIVRDVFNEDFHRLVVSGQDARDTIGSYLSAVAPDLQDRLEVYEDADRDPFDEYRVSEQIDKALERKVWLPSGGSLVIDRTEAMTVIDVNTGKFVGSGGNLEETVTKNNLEAAEEIVRQLRLRDIGGIIVVDFIDMVLESNRDLVLRRLVECLSRDRTKHQVAEVTSLGLVQMTRKKLGLGLLESFSEPCEVCAGRGLIVHHDPVVKHRGGQSDGGNGGGGSSRSRRGRGGSGAATTVKNGVGSSGTHAITEDVKNALAQIAKSTVHPDEQGGEGVAEAATAAAQAAIDILDIPVTAEKRAVGTISQADAEQILGSVLSALPEPKAPGQGRRSRRASSSGAVVTPGPDASSE